MQPCGTCPTHVNCGYQEAEEQAVSVNHAVLILLLVQPLGNVVIAVILLDRSGKEGVGPLERMKEGGTDNPEGDMHLMTIMSSRLSKQTQ